MLTHANYTGIAGAFKQSAARIQDVWASMPQLDFTGMKFFNKTEYAVTEQIDTLRGAGTGFGSLEVEA